MLSQREVGQRLHLPKTTVQKIEASALAKLGDGLRALAAAEGLSVLDWLAEDTGRPARARTAQVLAYFDS